VTGENRVDLLDVAGAVGPCQFPLLAPLALDGTSAGGFLRVIRANALEHAGLTFLALVGPLLCSAPGVTRLPYRLTPLMTWTLRRDVPAMTCARRMAPLQQMVRRRDETGQRVVGANAYLSLTVPDAGNNLSPQFSNSRILEFSMLLALAARESLGWGPGLRDLGVLSALLRSSG